MGVLLIAIVHLAPLLDVVPVAYANAYYSFIYLNAVLLGMGMTFPFFVALQLNAPLTRLAFYFSSRSYAIYLLNYSLLLLPIQWMTSDWEQGLLQRLAQLILYLVFTFALSELLYAYYERPILQWRNRNVPRLRKNS